MLTLSDKSRRRIALALFAVLCASPTLIVAAWGVSRHLPWHVRGEAQRLGWQLGMNVSLSAVEHPRPGVVRYEGLVLANPETGQKVACCRMLEATRGRTSERDKPARPLLTLVATRPEIEASALDEVRRLVDRVLAGRAGPLDLEVRLSAESLKVRSESISETFSDLKATLQTLPEGTLAKVDFRLPGRSTSNPAWVYLGRYRRDASPVSVLGLDTGGSDLSCPVLALACEGLAALGPQSRFRGAIDGRETADGWEIVLSGHFSDVELGRLAGDRFPSWELSGSAQIDLDEAVVLDGRLQKAAGALMAGPGNVNSRLVDAATRRLGLEGNWDSSGADRAIGYDELAAAFSLDGEGLRVRGLCSAGGRGTILAGRQGPILAEPKKQPLPLADLVQAVIPDASAQRSPQSRRLADLQAEWLLRRMPLPGLVRFAALGDGAPPSQASRARLSDPR